MAYRLVSLSGFLDSIWLTLVFFQDWGRKQIYFVFMDYCLRGLRLSNLILLQRCWHLERGHQLLKHRSYWEAGSKQKHLSMYNWKAPLVKFVALSGRKWRVVEKMRKIESLKTTIVFCQSLCVCELFLYDLLSLWKWISCLMSLWFDYSRVQSDVMLQHLTDILLAKAIPFPIYSH